MIIPGAHDTAFYGTPSTLSAVTWLGAIRSVPSRQIAFCPARAAVRRKRRSRTAALDYDGCR